MYPWTRLSDAPLIFTRPLGLTESAFYYDTEFSGTSDSNVQGSILCDQILIGFLKALQQITLEIPAHASYIFSSENIKRAWLTLKSLQPLLGASVYEQKDTNSVGFVINESKLGVVGPNEVVFVSLESDGEACALVDRILNQPRRLSNELPAQVWIISLPQDNASSSLRHQIFFHLAHYISDGIAQNTIMKTFFDILVHSEAPDLYAPKNTLEQRIRVAIAMDDLYPTRKYSLARRRWRFAIARVIHLIRQAAMKGGHTLPCSVALHKPAVSRTLRISLSKDLSRRVIASCRRARITFGVALPVLCQLAHARILHRLHEQGSISEAEWAHRIKQPMHTGGPLNLRPHLDPAWLASGGTDQVCVAISFFINTLPSLPSPKSSRTAGSHPFEELLSKPRFFNRCLEIKRQTDAFMGHPLFMEFTQVDRPLRSAKAKAKAMNWKLQRQVEVEHAMPLADEFMLSNACSSMGNMDNMLPSSYPMKRSIDGPSLCLTSIRHYLRCRPAEFYLTSILFLQELQLIVFCDVRTYDETMVQEWLTEVGNATEWYLGAGEGGRNGKL